MFYACPFDDALSISHPQNTQLTRNLSAGAPAQADEHALRKIEDQVQAKERVIAKRSEDIERMSIRRSSITFKPAEHTIN